MTTTDITSTSEQVLQPKRSPWTIGLALAKQMGIKTAGAAGTAVSRVGLGAIGCCAHLLYTGISTLNSPLGTMADRISLFVRGHVKSAVHKVVMSHLKRHQDQSTRWTSDVINDVLPNLLSYLLTDATLDRLVSSFSCGLLTHGRDAFDALSGELKRVYADYLRRNQTPEKLQSREAQEAKRIVHLIIDHLANAIREESSISGKLALIKDPTRLESIVQGALHETSLMQGSSVCPERMKLFLHHAIPNLGDLVIGIANRSTPKTARGQTALLKLATSILPKKVDSAHIDRFMRFINYYGLPRGISRLIYSAGADKAKNYFYELAQSFGLHLKGEDLNALIHKKEGFFDHDRLSDSAMNLLKRIQAKCRGKSALHQAMQTVAHLSAHFGYMPAEAIEKTVESMEKAATCTSSAIVVDVIATVVCPKVLHIPTRPAIKVGSTTLLPPALAKSVARISKPLTSSSGEIKAAVSQAMPWVMFQALCSAMGHSEMASEENYLEHVAPYVDMNHSMGAQIRQIARVLKQTLMPAYTITSIGAFFKLSVAATTLATSYHGINALIRKAQNSLNFASYHLSDTQALDGVLAVFNVVLEEIKGALLSLEAQGIARGSNQWKREITEIIDRQKLTLVNIMNYSISRQIHRLPIIRFKTLKAILNDKTLSPKKKALFIVKALLELLVSPLTMLFLMTITAISNRKQGADHPIYKVLSVVFEKLDIEKDDNLLSCIVEQTNAQLLVQEDKLAVDNTTFATPMPDNPQFDRFLIDFATTLVDKSSEVSHSFSVANFFSSFRHHLLDAAKSTRKAVISNLTPADVRGYIAAGVRAFIPKKAEDTPNQSYKEHVTTLADKAAAAIHAVLKQKTRQLPFSEASALFQLRELFDTQSGQFADELHALSKGLRKTDSTDHNELMIKKIYFKTLYFMQELEKSATYLKEANSEQATTLRELMQQWHTEFSLLTRSFDQVRRSKKPGDHIRAFVAFQNHTRRFISLARDNQIRDLAHTLWQERSDIFASCSRQHSVLEPAMDVARHMLPTTTKKHVGELSHLVSHLAVVPPV